MGIEAIIVMFFAAVLLVGGGAAAAKFLAPTSVNPQKLEAYECGVPTQGDSHIQFKVGYYLFAILFLLFDVEMIFLVPWAVVMKDIGLTGLISAVIFILVLGLGLLYAWKKKALVWE